MIEYRKGNLLDVTQGIIVHGCNAQGVMGSGVAKAVKDKYPGAYMYYKQAVNNSDAELGDVIWYQANEHLVIANAITQEYYGRDGKRYANYAAIARGFRLVFMRWGRFDYEAVYFPKIGAGLGGGDWNIIEQIINDTDPHNKVKKVCYEL